MREAVARSFANEHRGHPLESGALVSTEQFDPSPQRGDRKRLQFTLRRMFICTAVIAVVVAFPTIALIALFVVCVLCLVGVFFAAMLAEGAFLDWLDSKPNSDDSPSDKPNEP